jgi:hypothetical protein
MKLLPFSRCRVSAATAFAQAWRALAPSGINGNADLPRCLWQHGEVACAIGRGDQPRV